MIVLNSFISKKVLPAVLVVFACYACHNQSPNTPVTKPAHLIQTSHKTKNGKPDTAMILMKNFPPADSSMVNKHIAADSIITDSSAVKLEENPRKLDIRYFKRSFNLHRRTFITWYQSDVSQTSERRRKEDIG